ncbi:MAG: hypothetical protein Q9179_006878 [Wetmoreana sp. 5 TL-2023]
MAGALIALGLGQKWVSILLAVFGATQVVSTSDRSQSRQPVFLAGLLALAAATTMLYIGDSLVLLVIGGAAQGMATAVVHTVGIPLIVDKSPADQLGSALGVVGTSIATAVVVGPIIGGFLCRHAGYHAVFALSYALLAIDVVLRIFLIEKPPSMNLEVRKQQQIRTKKVSNNPEHEDDRSSSTSVARGSDPKIFMNSGYPKILHVTQLWNRIPGVVWLLMSPRI